MNRTCVLQQSRWATLPFQLVCLFLCWSHYPLASGIPETRTNNNNNNNNNNRAVMIAAAFVPHHVTTTTPHQSSCHVLRHIFIPTTVCSTATATATTTSCRSTMSRVDMEAALLAPNQTPLIMATQQERDQAMIVAQEEARKAAADWEANLVLQQQQNGRPRYRNNDDHLYSPLLDTTGFGAVLVEQGVARIDGVLSPNTAINTLAYVNQQLLDSQEEVATYKATQGMRFGNVLAKTNRWDLLLPFEESEAMLQALDELIGEKSTVGSVIDAAIGKDAELYELGAIISDPGSGRQEIHPDIEYQEYLIPLLTCFIALQDIDASMGPTVFLPKTHKDESAHCMINDAMQVDNFLRMTPSRLSTLNIGDCSIYNPSALHAGGGNRSDRRRVLLYVTFRNTAFPDPSTDLNPGSIRPELKRRRLSISTMRSILTSREKNG